ncbi:MAG TPA: TylF/MycF/NovP-related O-methyltransferase [Pyrinomonadaceae bacterium]|nr:TylF/MycF/NovP-related O-methyltransferase [Pyrinomonadaceae bacterium]
MIERDPRWETFTFALKFLGFEKVRGDIAEFGVFTGVSLALLAHAYQTNVMAIKRRVVGFDSFKGLPPSEEKHERWREGWFSTNLWWHPLLPFGKPVTPEVTLDLFRACELPEPSLEVGGFEETARASVPSKYSEIALLHIDCDLYESTRAVFEAVAPALQEGTVVLFDDWFHYKGDPRKGESKAFTEFLRDHPEWGAQHYRSYAIFGNAFILYRK